MAFLAEAEFNCPKIVDLVVKTLPGFRDQAIYAGVQVFFYKRAQILVSDLVGAFDDYKTSLLNAGMNTDHIPEFRGKEELTMFADYRVPQILRHLGIFVYSEQLAAVVDGEKELAYSSKLEVELRAATVVTVDRIMETIRANGSQALREQVQRSYEVDWLLWQMGEKTLAEMKPHHRVTSIYY